MIDKTNATFFEVTTCIAFQYFADEGVDIAVIEVGLGGRLDSTNVLRPLVSVITNVSIDHAEFLGSSLKSIAREKGGIIKKGIPCVTATSSHDVLASLKRIAVRRKARILHVDDVVSTRVVSDTNKKLVIDMRSKKRSLRKARLGLTGSHQVVNASTAVATVDVLMREKLHARRFAAIDSHAIRRGLENVRRNTGLGGRLEWHTDRILLDVAHNVEGLRTLSAAISSRIKNNLIVVFGVMRDKDYEQMCEIVGQLGKRVIAVKATGRRALAGSEIVRTFKQMNLEVMNGGSVANGIMIAKRLSGSHGKILITGSNYVVGEALEALRRKRKLHGRQR